MPQDSKLDKVDYIAIGGIVALSIGALVYFAYAHAQFLQAVVQYCQVYICK